MNTKDILQQYTPPFDLIEDLLLIKDSRGKRICLVGHHEDGALIVAALNEYAEARAKCTCKVPLPSSGFDGPPHCLNCNKDFASPVSRPTITHINASPEFLKDPKNVEMIEKMATLAYNQISAAVPQEQQKEAPKETVKEAAEKRYAYHGGSKRSYYDDLMDSCRIAFKAGAEWQAKHTTAPQTREGGENE